MKVLLDTHFLLWAVLHLPRLDEFPWLDRYRPWGVSPVSLLEIQFLADVGRLEMSDAIRPEGGELRLAELLAALSLASDLGMGHPPEEAMRTCLLATALTRLVGLPEEEVADVYWTALLMHVGCTAFAHEQAALFGGDEIRVNDVGSRTDFGDPKEAVRFLVELTRGMTPPRRARVFMAGLAAGDRFGRKVATSTCEVAAMMARRLGLPEGVQRGLSQMFERWDGRGDPRKLAGEAIALPARAAEVAAQATVFARLGGLDAAVSMARRRAGKALDPKLAAAFAAQAEELLEEVDADDPAVAVLQAEPLPHLRVPEGHLDEVASAFADVADLKSPFTVGHSAGVAELAEGAGRALALGDEECIRLRRAGLFHDLGRVGIPNGIWEKAGPLTTPEWERVRLHPYHTERILSCSPTLEEVAELAGLHHERLDGSGYYRGTRAGGLPLAARVLAAADAFQAMTQPRPHRDPIPTEAAGARLVTEAKAGRLDRSAVDAVLSAAGQTFTRIRPRPPGGLTEREIDVLRLLAQGHTNREIGRLLFISPKTVGSHVEHIYGKLGVSSRAAATMFAAEHALVQPPAPVSDPKMG